MTYFMFELYFTILQNLVMVTVVNLYSPKSICTSFSIGLYVCSKCKTEKRRQHYKTHLAISPYDLIFTANPNHTHIY